MFMKKTFMLTALIMATGNALRAEDLQEISLAIGTPDPVRVEQLIKSKKYSAAEMDQLVKYADEIVAYNDANFNKKTEAAWTIGGVAISVGFTGFNIYKIITASNDNERLGAIISTAVAGLLFLGIDIWSI